MNRMMAAIGGVVIAVAVLIGLGALVTRAFGQDQESLLFMYPEGFFGPTPDWLKSDAPTRNSFGPRQKPPSFTMDIEGLPMVDFETLPNTDAKRDRSRLRVVDDFWYPPPFFTPEEIEHIRRMQGDR